MPCKEKARDDVNAPTITPPTGINMDCERKNDYRAPTSRSSQFRFAPSSTGGMSARFSSFSADSKSNNCDFSAVAVSVVLPSSQVAS